MFCGNEVAPCMVLSSARVFPRGPWPANSSSLSKPQGNHQLLSVTQHNSTFVHFYFNFWNTNSFHIVPEFLKILDREI